MRSEARRRVFVGLLAGGGCGDYIFCSLCTRSPEDAMPKPKSGRPITVYTDARTAAQAQIVAAAENRKLAQIGGEALALWTSLPAAARTALRYIQGLGSEQDLECAYREMTRALLNAQRAVASEQASMQIRAQFEGIERLSDGAIDELAVELADNRASSVLHQRRRSHTPSPDGSSRKRSRSLPR